MNETEIIAIAFSAGYLVITLGWVFWKWWPSKEIR